jgi:hypothetical protein
MMKTKFFNLLSAIIVLALVLAGFSAVKAQDDDGNEHEVIYLSDALQLGDGLSRLFQVSINDANSQAEMTLLPNGDLPFDNVDVLAVTPDGGRIYMINDGVRTYPHATMAYYDVATDQLVTVGDLTLNGDDFYRTDQGAFSLDGVFYITSTTTDMLYTVNVETAEVTEVGPIVDETSGEVVDIWGADIIFTADGSTFMITNAVTTAAFRLTLPDGPGAVSATKLSPTGDDHRVLGMAVRANGYGDLLALTRADELHVIDKLTGEDVSTTITLYWNDEVYDMTNGDMSIGVFALCTNPKIWWETNPWDGAQVTVVGTPVDEALGKQIMVKAHWANFSKMIAQLVTAKLNVNNATGIEVIDSAEAWLATQGVVQADGTLDWDKAFESREQQDAAFRFFVSLQKFNTSSPCQ